MSDAMKKHLKNTDIIDYITGGSADHGSALAEHIDRCPRCKELYSEILPLISSSGKPSVEPGAGVRKRIIKTYREYSPKESAAGNFIGVLGWIRANRLKTAVAAAVIFVLAGVPLYFGVSSLTKREVLPIYVYYYRGSPTIDDEKVRYHMPIRDRSEIRVDKNSVLVLARKNRFIVKLYGQSEMVLKKHEAKNARGGNQFVFNLNKGTIYTKYRQNSHETKYFYFSPNASLASRKSSFIMSVAGNRTIVISKEGALNIRSLASKENINASPEQHYVISSSIEINGSVPKETDYLKNHLEKPFSEEEILLLNTILDSII